LYVVVIPARYASTRLPGKPLLPIAGKPMLQWVYEHACAAQATEVVIATDDERIAESARGFARPQANAASAVVMTAASHASGTDRVAEVARTRGWPERQIVVNVQGDEPLMPPQLVRQVALLLDQHPRADIATLAAPIESLADFLDPNVVKVVADAGGRVLYFSRAPIPWVRDGAPSGLASQARWEGARRHVGIYAYRVGALQRMAALPASPLESAERLEQLRALEAGFEIRVAPCERPPGPDVNTARDLERAGALLLAAGVVVPAAGHRR
jgi:3-deoxy-manno-octulosonate cytidylyltransferase (CMP-KDO synthetase)